MIIGGMENSINSNSQRPTTEASALFYVPLTDGVANPAASVIVQAERIDNFSVAILPQSIEERDECRPCFAN